MLFLNNSVFYLSLIFMFPMVLGDVPYLRPKHNYIYHQTVAYRIPNTLLHSVLTTMSNSQTIVLYNLSLMDRCGL